MHFAPGAMFSFSLQVINRASAHHLKTKNMQRMTNLRKLQILINTHGYWSKEVREFNDALPPDESLRLNDRADHNPHWRTDWKHK
jgi:hypothetical protein